MRSASSIIATEAFAKVVDALLEAGKDAAKDSAEKLIVDGVHKLLEELSEALSGPQALDRPEGGHPEVHETPLLQSLEAHEQFPLSKTVHIVEMVNDVPTTYLAAIVVLRKCPIECFALLSRHLYLFIFLVPHHRNFKKVQNRRGVSNAVSCYFLY